MIYESGLVSLLIQILTGAVDVLGLFQPVTKRTSLLHQLLQVEFGVQVVEFIFYLWLIFSLHSSRAITRFRYYDWFITTPIMLFTLMALLHTNPEADTIPSLAQFFSENKRIVLEVVILNAAMLVAGYLSELFPVYQIPLVIAGAIPFFLYFWKIYSNYVEPNKDKPSYVPRHALFFYFFVVWGLYGVAALAPHRLKNTGYNILDLFAKNFFGVYLVSLIFQQPTLASAQPPQQP